ncbi:MAG: helix-turn-helix domain-containing protein [Chloroflexota bacterium]
MGNETVRGLLRQYADYLTPEQTADILGVSVGTVYRHLQAGDLAGFQLGRQWRIPPDELDKFRQRSSS